MKALELAAELMCHDIILGAYLGFTHHEIEYKKCFRVDTPTQGIKLHYLSWA